MNNVFHRLSNGNLRVIPPIPSERPVRRGEPSVFLLFASTDHDAVFPGHRFAPYPR